MFGRIPAVACGALLFAFSATAQAADVIRKIRSKTGSEVTIFADGTAHLSNPALRWAASGRWTRQGQKYCVDWRERASPRQCYW